MASKHCVRTVLVVLLAVAAAPALAGFSGTDVFLPSVGAKPGVPPAVWYTTVWVHNPNPTAANVTVYLLERQANLSPLTYTDTVPAGDTKKYDNAVQLMFARQTFGALRVTSNVKVIVGSRIYSQSGDLEDSVGQYFAGTPASFAIGAGESTELVGVYGTLPAASSTFRYNFGFVETTGTGTCQVKVIVKDATGATQGTKTYPVRQWEQMQKSFKDEFPSLSTQNARLTVEVISGIGKVIAFGSSVANGSQDPATFEMAFRDSLLAENGTGGLAEVSHDGSLTGAGTTSSLLGIADSGVTAGKIASGQVVKSLNGLKDAVTLAPGANITLTPSGNTLTIAATGGSGGTGVPSVNGITGAVTIAATSGATVNTSGNTITIGASGSGGGVPSVNGITSAVTIAGAGTATVSTSGGTVTVNGTGLSAVTPGTGLAGNGTPGSPLEIASGAVGFDLLADGGVKQPKLSVTGTPSSGQVLGTDGTRLVWQADGLSLPFQASVPTCCDDAFKVEAAGTAVLGRGSIGVEGLSDQGQGVLGIAGDIGVRGASQSGVGVEGESFSRHTRGRLGFEAGVEGNGGETRVGVFGFSYTSFGVHGKTFLGTGVYGDAEGSSYAHAGYFNGWTQVVGNFDVGSGTKNFLIDHPLDPANRYLRHAAVESSEVLDTYSGNVVTDDQGLAAVQLPEWFEALNTDFRYQLTCIGRFAQAIVEQEIAGNRFTIRTNLGGVKVSWEVTAKRNDAWMKAHPFAAEQDKPEAERGLYLAPAEHGQPKEKGVTWQMVERAGGHREGLQSVDPGHLGTERPTAR